MYMHTLYKQKAVLTHSELPQLQLKLCVINLMMSIHSLTDDSDYISDVLESSMGTTEICQQSQTEVECKFLISGRFTSISIVCLM